MITIKDIRYSGLGKDNMDYLEANKAVKEHLQNYPTDDILVTRIMQQLDEYPELYKLAFNCFMDVENNRKEETK